jgi:hypothetical protein
MALIQKTLFPENLDRYNVFVQDTEPNSRYFNITELPDTFTGGKNAFLIAGASELVADTLIKIEIKDAAGNIIYHEPGEGSMVTTINGVQFTNEYYEGVSKVVSVYVYPGDTAYGPCTITILGELSSYYDSNGLLSPIPLNWEGQYNVKWQKTINVNPTLANTTKIRFYKRPTASIKEILSPIYSIVGNTKVASVVTQSFADIKISNLETFAGDVKRIKVFRTSIGDISDYDMIQDILVESKELLTSYNLSGSVIGNTGIFTSETLKNYWNTGSLNTYLTSSRVESGVALNGSGNFRYTSSLDIKSTNTYELNLDAFYSSSVDSNLGIYLISGSTSSSIGTLYGTQPTKNLLDTVIPFKLDRNYPSASLYFSQSQGEWHLGNVSLKLSEDTVFSPDEVSFVTTMPTVLGNETFNFKFEFYDVNNNYVPVAVTQSALFNGGNNNVGGTLTYISSSASSSLENLNRVSASISGTMTTYSSSASSSVGVLSGSVSGSLVVVSGSVYTLSGSVSGTIGVLSGSVSRSVALTLSASLSTVKLLADGGYPGTFIESSSIYSPNIAGQQGYISEKFQVGKTTPIVLDARTSTRKIYIGGVNDTGSYNSGSTSVYMDSSGKFSLKDKLTWDGSALSVDGTITATAGTIGGVNIASGKLYTGTGTFGATNTGFYLDSAGQLSLKDKLTWNGTTLNVTGNINIVGGDAAGKIERAASSGSNAQATADSAASAAATAASAAATAAGAAATAQSAAEAAANKIFTDAAGKITKVAAPTGKGLFLDSTHLGFYNTTDYPSSPWRTYMTDTGNFYLAGSSAGGLSWDGASLSIDGNITARNGTFIGNITSTATISGGTISGGTLTGGSINIGSGKFAVSELGIMSCTGANISGIITATQGNIGGWQINPDGLQFTSIDGARGVKLNSNRGALELSTSGSVTVDINSNQFLTDLTAGTTVSSGYSLFVPSGTISGNGTPKYGSAEATGFTLVAGQTYQFLHNSGYMYPVNVYSSQYNSIQYGVLISTDANPTLENSNINIAGSRYKYGSGQLQPLQITGNFTATATGTYYIRPYITLYSYESQAGNDFGGYIEYSYTPVNGDLTGDLYFYGPSISRSTQKTEVVGGGIQVVKDIDTYFKVDRNANTYEPFVKSSGANVTFEGIGTGYENTFTVDKFTTVNINSAGSYISMGGSNYMGIYGSEGIRISPGKFVHLEPGSGHYAIVGNSPTVASQRILTGSGGPSDIRLKTEIEELSESSLEKINELKVKSFKFKENGREGDAYGEKKIGVIAQEVLNTSISYVVNQNWPEIDGDYNVDHFSILGHAIKAIQELSAKVEELEAKISGSI